MGDGGPSDVTASAVPQRIYDQIADNVSGSYQGPFTPTYLNWKALPGWEGFWSPATGNGDNYQEDNLRIPELVNYLDKNNLRAVEQTLPNNYTTRFIVGPDGKPIENTRVTFQERQSGFEKALGGLMALGMNAFIPGAGLGLSYLSGATGLMNKNPLQAIAGFAGMGSMMPGVDPATASLLRNVSQGARGIGALQNKDWLSAAGIGAGMAGMPGVSQGLAGLGALRNLRRGNPSGLLNLLGGLRSLAPNRPPGG